MKKNRKFKWAFVSICGIIAVMISFTLVHNLVIPDACYYHTHDMNPVLNLFYSACPATNGHPEPNTLNLLLSLFVGGITGNEIYKKLI